MRSNSIIIFVLAVFVVGSITSATMAYAASNAQGQPFQAIQEEIDSFFDVFYGDHTVDSFFDIFTNPGEAAPDSFFDVFVEIDERDEQFQTEILSLQLQGDGLQEQIDGLGSENSFTVDSFFDVFYEIDLNSSSCPEGQLPKVDPDLQTTTCVPEGNFQVDSFFDVFYEIEGDVAQETQDRIAADDDLQDALDAEIARAIAKDDSLMDDDVAAQAARDILEGALFAESDARIQGDDQLTFDLLQEVSNRIADVNAEEAARTLADTLFSEKLTDLDEALDAEAQAREAADDDLQDALDAEIARAIADVNDEEARAIAAEAALQAALIQEIADREAADAALSGDNLGNHMAEQDLDMKTFDINNVGNLILAGSSTVGGSTTVAGDSTVGGNSLVVGISTVQGNSQVFGNLEVGGNSNLIGDSNIIGNSAVVGNSDVGGSLTVSGPSSFFGPIVSPSVTGTNELCIGGDCRTSWPAAGGGIIEVGTGAGLTGGPINSGNPVGTISLATGGITSSHILDGTITTDDIDTSSFDTRYANSGTFQLVLNPNGAVPADNTNVSYKENQVAHRNAILPTTGTATLFMPVNGIPDGATITKLECSSIAVGTPQVIGPAGVSFQCSLVRSFFGGVVSAALSTPEHFHTNHGWETFSSTSGVLPISSNEHLVLKMFYNPNGVSCGSGDITNCAMGAARITYTVP